MALLRTIIARHAGNITPWKEVETSPQSSVLIKIATDGTTYAACENNSASNIYYTTDPSNTWSASSNTVNGQATLTLNYGNSYWFAGCADNYIYTSSSASGTWTSRFDTGGGPRDIIYSSTASLYISVGGGGIHTASDPTSTWTSRQSGSFRAVHDNGSLIVAVGDNGALYTSTNGTSWTSRTSGFGTDAILGLTYNNSIWVFVGVNSKIGTSTDPTSSVTLNTSSGVASGLTFTSVAYDGSEFIIVRDTHMYKTSNPSSSWQEKTFTGKYLTHVYADSSFSFITGLESSVGLLLYKDN